MKYYLGCFTKQNFLCICYNKGIYLSFHTQVAFAGCTACVVYVGADAIHVANAGDCRAVLGVREMDGSWSALELSLDHNSNNQAEVEKIKAQHPPSEKDTVIVDDRLLGVRASFILETAHEVSSNLLLF